STVRPEHVSVTVAEPLQERGRSLDVREQAGDGPCRQRHGRHRNVLAMVETTLYSDAGCPWAYSAAPALRGVEWGCGEQAGGGLGRMGLTERAEQSVERGYTPLRSARGYASRFRRDGMPFSPEPRERVIGTGRACRAVVAARILRPGSEWPVFRALQFA